MHIAAAETMAAKRWQEVPAKFFLLFNVCSILPRWSKRTHTSLTKSARYTGFQSDGGLFHGLSFPFLPGFISSAEESNFITLFIGQNALCAFPSAGIIIVARVFRNRSRTPTAG
jgi:hypothetical protein